MAPTVDSNLPPETWITAAPQDTITTRDDNGNLVPPQLGSIPFRHHLYWSGSDQDGKVAGFYWAVVETVGSVAGLPIPPLPGPKPQDYHFTPKTDSVFIFNVLEATSNRQHAFYIYAVDEKGKPDATPARVVFNTLDLFPPVPVIEAECGVKNPLTGSRATGNIFHANEAWDGGTTFPTPRETTIALCDSFSRGAAVSSIVPVGSIVRMKWHSEIRVANNPAIAYKYKSGEGSEVEFVQVPASVTSTEYNTTANNKLGPGLKIFTLRAIDQAGGARTSPETTRSFYMNYTPDTWFAGPDSVPAGSPNFYTVERYANQQVRWRYFQVGTGPPPQNWTRPLPGSLLSPDSVIVMPAKRKPNKTFFEIYTENTNPVRHRIYVHSEGDTVHMNSYVLFYGGGFDADSPYSLRTALSNPSLPAGSPSKPVLLPSDKANGSPIGQHFLIPVMLDSLRPPTPGAGQRDAFPQSRIYPLSEASSPPEPHIGGYQGLQKSGRAYMILRSEDGSGDVDNRIADPVAFVDSIERGLISPGSPRYALKDKVLTFYVNRAPYLLRDDPAFEPDPGQVFFTRNVTLRLDLVADDDPYQSTQRSVGGVEAGRSVPLYRYSVTLRGLRTGSNPPRDTVYAPAELSRKIGTNLQWHIDVPAFIQGPNVAVDIEVCDCKDCEVVPGEGRCRRYPSINVTVPALTAGPSAAPSRATSSSIGPGSSGESRSRTP